MALHSCASRAIGKQCRNCLLVVSQESSTCTSVILYSFISTFSFRFKIFARKAERWLTEILKRVPELHILWQGKGDTAHFKTVIPCSADRPINPHCGVNQQKQRETEVNSGAAQLTCISERNPSVGCGIHLWISPRKFSHFLRKMIYWRYQTASQQLTRWGQRDKLLAVAELQLSCSRNGCCPAKISMVSQWVTCLIKDEGA